MSLLGNMTNGWLGDEDYSHKKSRKDVETAKKVAEAQAEAQEKAIRRALRAEEERAAAEEERIEAAELKALLDGIRDTEFSTDESEFVKEMTVFLTDMEDSIKSKNGYKKYKAYKQRLEKELKVLQRSNDKRYDTIKADCDEAFAKCKKFYKKWAIIAGSIFGVCVIGSIIIGLPDSVGISIFIGLLFGGITGGALFAVGAKM
ncbi:hypothetical protein E4O05_06145 [Treponema sp. OMZ 787]|uniref:hypothetical protein n=1 Tax=Treponema sp. OMZ 787 TaxID=2563669 RepID=UPI0020A234E3|nr:hypothetical protein [Treponema sp. OMZ 787]UTC63461.1 hypothetical protein E4O05_06145 [Treponema sp. OMZ 787]